MRDSLTRRIFFVGARPAEAGYNLVVLIVAITVLNVLVAAMLPLWSTAIRREKEEELAFRGFQYAEAIRVFNQRFQRYPNKLEELIEVKPRCIRQLWKDPMTEDGRWGLIFQNLQPPPQSPQNPEGGGAQMPGEGEEGDENGRPQLGPGKGETVQVGPIIGVHSKSGKKSFLVLFGRERYDEWQFTDALLPGGGSQPGRPGGEPEGMMPPPGTPGSLPSMSTLFTGRPMRFLNPPAPPQGGTMPDGSRPGQPRTKPPARPSSKPR